MSRWNRLNILVVLAPLLTGTALSGSLVEHELVFLAQAAQNSQADFSAGRLALTKARNPQVRVFAQRTIDEHLRMSEDLRVLAAAKNFKPPEEATVLQRGKEKLIGGLSDDFFDRRYVLQMGVNAHENSVRLFENALRDARDPEVKAFAAKHLPELREQLKAAHELKEAVEPVAPAVRKRFSLPP